MTAFSRGRYAARLAAGPEDVEAAQRLRFRAFIEGRGAAVEGPRAQGLDADDLDPFCEHMLIEERRSGRLICCFRMMPLANGAEIARSYSARYYDLSSLRDYPDSMVEMGRFCIDPDFRDPDVIRVAWSAMMRYVDDRSVGMVFGCSSFKGVDAEAYMDAFALLKERHLAPKRWLPRVKAPRVFQYAARLKLRRPNMGEALKRMPPLLRSYLMLGGWVSDHAVIDHDLNTLHVFTGVEMRAVPPKRLQILRQA
jgi:putative hemolysin